MPRLYLVRHGSPAARWDEDPDPGLDPRGKAQAEAVAAALAKELRSMGVVTSPMRRCRETAAPLARLWGVEPMVSPGFAEIPSPTDDLDGRAAWLRALMPGRWPDQEAGLQAWRANVVRAFSALPGDAVVFTHYIPINVAVGAATGDDRIICFRPAHCSVTRIELVMEELRLLQKGREARTVVR